MSEAQIRAGGVTMPMSLFMSDLSPAITGDRPRPSTEKVCAQCGRKGVRGFKTIPEHRRIIARQVTTIPALTTCSNQNACRKRWSR